MLYDLEFKYKDILYRVEICGGLSEEYLNKQIFKRDALGAILVDRPGFKYILNDIQSGEELKNDYTKYGRKDII